ncbi:putative toxin-antitoxin system toxin component, PIN family [Blastochloris tepida]|uniref:putative toxin-antitoxin system toxin component, PIN family n=1 Tax=Blastochloris tepida TaxID=2233851 RepID=UPI001FCECC3F|nr:putative toxin-antitoxin system toxin component, PIN family [Blastochloris tepida]
MPQWLQETPVHHIVYDMRVVLDTSAFVAAIRSPHGASAELLRRAVTGRLTLLASVALFAEYEAVATRSEHLIAAGATEADIRNTLDVLAGWIEPVEIFFLWRPRLRDPDDDMVLETAVNGRATMIATFNVADFGAAASEFGMEIARPGTVLARLREET